VDFAQDAACRTYVVSLTGPIYRLDPAAGGAAHACSSTQPQEPLPGGGGGGGDPTITPSPTATPQPAVSPAALRLFGLSLSRTRVRAGGAVALRLTLSEAATVTARLYRVTAGHRRGGRCLPGTGGRRCVRYSLAAEVVHGVSAGRHSLALPHTARGKALALGTYRVTVAASLGPGRKATGQAQRFVVVGASR
jgi:hypothetical protein